MTPPTYVEEHSRPQTQHRTAQHELDALHAAHASDAVDLQQQDLGRHQPLGRQVAQITAAAFARSSELVAGYMRQFAGKDKVDRVEHIRSAGHASLMRAIQTYNPRREPFSVWA